MREGPCLEDNRLPAGQVSRECTTLDRAEAGADAAQRHFTLQVGLAEGATRHCAETPLPDVTLRCSDLPAGVRTEA